MKQRRLQLQSATEFDEQLLDYLAHKFGDRLSAVTMQVLRSYFLPEMLYAQQNESKAAQRGVFQAVSELWGQVSRFIYLHQMPPLGVGTGVAGGLVTSATEPSRSVPELGHISSSVATQSGLTEPDSEAMNPDPEEVDEPEDSAPFISESDRALQAMGLDFTKMQTSRTY
jgi:hypothetical protein